MDPAGAGQRLPGGRRAGSAEGSAAGSWTEAIAGGFLKFMERREVRVTLRQEPPTLR